MKNTITDPLSIHTLPGSPARMTAVATIKLPRWGILLMCLLYILPGLVGRDPWKTEDATGFGVMWTMAQGRGLAGIMDWLLPNVAGAPVFDSGPLMYWLGAICIKLFSWLPGLLADGGMTLNILPHAARLATVLAFLLTISSIWYATYLLGRREDVQPLALAFGGQPAARDYGRVLADGAVLILLGTIGLLQRAHESSSDVAVLAMLALALYAMARSLEQVRAGALWLGVALAGLGLSDGQGAMFALLFLWLVLIAVHPEWKAARGSFVLITLPVALALLAIWPLLIWWLVPDASGYFSIRAQIWWLYFDGIDFSALRKYLKALAWYTWLAWPIALWALWSWRRHLGRAHIVLPGGYLLVTLLLLGSTSDTSDGQLLMLLPGLVMLAAFGLPTFKRGTANAIDWFSLLLYSLTALFIWFSWLARMTGSPKAWANSIARQTPGFIPEFHPLLFIVAMLATAGWFWLVHWRIVKHPRVLWRSVVLASGGLVLTWVLINTLFLQSINYSRTYRDVATALAAKMNDAQTQQCVRADGLGLAQRASFAYFADLRFVAETASTNKMNACPYLLRQDSVPQKRSDQLPYTDGRWKLVWEGRRVSDKTERFRLYRRVAVSEAD